MNTGMNRTLSCGMPILASLLVLSAAPLSSHAADPFADIIRKTEPLTAEQEQKTFHLPPGFEIQLVAQEPDIGKPMNLQFDEQGRLWLTQSREYPFPAPLDKPARDAIKILSNFAPDGRAQTVSTFATGLNIPIGIYPYKGGAIAFSIPYIHFYQDTNSDGAADGNDIVLGRFGFDRDTHGLTSAFRRGYDGWIYADHGFNNNTTLTAKDGSTITMNSGNCYRFLPDGSHVEQYSWGQVNPFGLMFDPLGELWSADCHSMPVYVLLRGAYYPSFGKPDDGLGFAPRVIDHQHGSTAIAGMVYYAATNFPTEFRGNTFIGNVMTSRINRDSYVEHGSTRPGKEEPDFLSCDDPWFRPVDLQLGPDGALYVADFYNRIIGHYEVPLDNPGRDRERGRVWRIVYTGKPGSNFKAPAMPQAFDLSKSSARDLIRVMADPNIELRMQAMNQLVDRVGKPAIAPVQKMMRDRATTAFQKIHGLWVLNRLGGQDDKILTAAAHDKDRGVRTHVMRVLSETPSLTAPEHALAVAGLLDTDGFVERAAADALGRHAEVDNIRPLLDLLARVPDDDTQLRHTARMSLRNQLLPSGALAKFQPAGEKDSRAIADVAVAAPSEEAGAFLLQHLQRYAEDRATMGRYLRHAARYISASQVNNLAIVARQKFSGDLSLQVDLFNSVHKGLQERGTEVSNEVRDWGASLVDGLLKVAGDQSTAWRNTPLAGTKDSANPWGVQVRPSADGNESSRFLSSLPSGESLTGTLRSPEFTIPEKLEFYMAGHDGYPDKKLSQKNLIRLRSATDGRVLAKQSPPRNDTAQKFSWDLKSDAGQKGYVEIVDGDSAGAYAWLAVGRFQPPVVSVPEFAPNALAAQQQTAAEVARTLKLTKFNDAFAELAGSDSVDLKARAAAAQTLAAQCPDESLQVLAPFVGEAGLSSETRSEIAHGLTVSGTEATHKAVADALRTAPYRLQVRMAQALAGVHAGAEALLTSIEQGQAPPLLLLDRNVKDKLTASKPDRGDERIAALCKNLTPASEQVQKLIDERLAAYSASKPSPTAGMEVFTKNCSICHSIDGHGGLVGPQLDGVGGRGLERLVEDVLDPNRNVDRAFRAHIIKLKDGDVISGLPRREEGELLILADSTAKEITVAKKDIEMRRESESSLMPDNFGEAIPPQDFFNLMSFLLTKNLSSAKK